MTALGTIQMFPIEVSPQRVLQVPRGYAERASPLFDQPRLILEIWLGRQERHTYWPAGAVNRKAWVLETISKTPDPGYSANWRPASQPGLWKRCAGQGRI